MDIREQLEEMRAGAVDPRHSTCDESLPELVPAIDAVLAALPAADRGAGDIVEMLRSLSRDIGTVHSVSMQRTLSDWRRRVHDVLDALSKNSAAQAAAILDAFTRGQTHGTETLSRALKKILPPGVLALVEGDVRRRLNEIADSGGEQTTAPDGTTPWRCGQCGKDSGGPCRWPVQLEHSTAVVHGHRQTDCSGQPCTLHNRTDHHMRAFPQAWRSDRRLMERVCPHGIGHPDPDDQRIRNGEDDGIHGCDGCCAPPMPAIEHGDVLISKFGNRWRVEAWEKCDDGAILFVLKNRPPEAPDAKGTVVSGPLPLWVAKVERNGRVIWTRPEAA